MPIDTQDILFEDNHLLAVNKKPGVLAQGDVTGDSSLVEEVREYLKVRYNKPGNVFAGLVHRLDRPVSGVILFAKTSKALERMARLFKDRQVKKIYLAIVAGKIEPEGVLRHWMTKDSAINKARVFRNESQGSKEAVLAYRILATLGGEHLLEATPHTGRPHQIRAQLSFAGAPVKGDLKYGYPAPNGDKSVCLHASRLSFVHPVRKEPVEIAAPYPSGPDWDAFRSIVL